MRANFNITDDKIRLDPEGVRLTDEQYKQAKACNFAWWPGRKIFAAKWSVSAEDFVLSLVPEIEEDDTLDDVESRVERYQKHATEAESNAERSAEYSTEATTARRRELSQQRAENESEKALYWTRRISGAIERATYREQPGVIARRIKGLEAEERKYRKESSDEECLSTALYSARVDLPLEGDIPEGIVGVRTYSAKINGIEQYQTRSGYDKAKLEAGKERHKTLYTRMLAHVQQRLEYERALLMAAGGLPTDGKMWEVGGAVLMGHEWQEIIKVNRTTFNSKSRYGSHIKYQKTIAKGLMTAEQYQAYQRGEFTPEA